MVSYIRHSAMSARQIAVLILIVVDNGLVPIDLQLEDEKVSTVLILVVVDNGLVPIDLQLEDEKVSTVLILVVVDNGLVLDLTRHY